MNDFDIEKFFLNTLLRVCIGGVLLILIFDALLYPADTLSLIIDGAILSACSVAFAVRNRSRNASVLILTWVVLIAMFYQCMAVPFNTTTSLSIILVVGFIFSVMLKGRIMWTMHAITFIGLNAIFAIQIVDPTLRILTHKSEIITIAITYSILYFILTYATGVLKQRYDKAHRELKDMISTLQEQANEIAAQNEELIQTQDNLNLLNHDLEKKVVERTSRIQTQNEFLIKYSYRNAHQLRGPVARLLGLASVSKIDATTDHAFIIQKMVDQALEIDVVIKQINKDLEANQVELE